jgi:hypothetical protein
MNCAIEHNRLCELGSDCKKKDRPDHNAEQRTHEMHDFNPPMIADASTR